MSPASGGKCSNVLEKLKPLTNFTNFIGKHLCCRLFFITLQLAINLKEFLLRIHKGILPMAPLRLSVQIIYWYCGNPYSSWDQDQNGIKFGIKHVTYKKLAKRICQQAGRCHLCHVNVYFADQNIMQQGDPIELNFEGLEMQQ